MEAMRKQIEELTKLVTVLTQRTEKKNKVKRLRRSNKPAFKFEWECPVQLVSYSDLEHYRSYFHLQREYYIYHVMIYTAIFGIITLEDYLKTAKGYIFTDVLNCMTHHAEGTLMDQHEHIHFIMAIPIVHHPGFRKRISRFVNDNIEAKWPRMTFLHKPINDMNHFLSTVSYIYEYRDDRYIVASHKFDDRHGKQTESVRRRRFIAYLQPTNEYFSDETFYQDHIENQCKFCANLSCHKNSHLTDFYYYFRHPYRLIKKQVMYIDQDCIAYKFFPNANDMKQKFRRVRQYGVEIKHLNHREDSYFENGPKLEKHFDDPNHPRYNL